MKELSRKKDLLDSIRAKKDKVNQLARDIQSHKDEVFALEETKANLE